MPVAINTYDVGDRPRCRATWTDEENGIPVDPTAVFVDIRKPNVGGGFSTTTYIYGTDAEVVRDSVGVYHIDIDVDITGVWHHRWYSTGPAQAAEERRFMVRPTYST